MKYFLDQEFHEGFHKPLFGKKRHFIDLISIAIVSEDGRMYYAISKDFDIDLAWKNEWLRENVLKNILNNDRFGNYSSIHTKKELKNLIWHFGKSNQEIAQEIIKFCQDRNVEAIYDPTIKGKSREYFFRGNPEFYGYYADYDWVLFCSMFGRMFDLPEGFPRYCRDLKQMLDEKIESGCVIKHRYAAFSERAISTSRGNSFDEVLRIIKEQPSYPKQENEHHALADAWWNKKLYDFIKSL